MDPDQRPAGTPARTPPRLLDIWCANGFAHVTTVLEPNVSTKMIYTHVLNRGARAVRSPLDGPG